MSAEEVSSGDIAAVSWTEIVCLMVMVEDDTG